jgi:hypothetical protein
LAESGPLGPHIVIEAESRYLDVVPADRETLIGPEVDIDHVTIGS